MKFNCACINDVTRRYQIAFNATEAQPMKNREYTKYYKCGNKEK